MLCHMNRIEYWHDTLHIIRDNGTCLKCAMKDSPIDETRSTRFLLRANTYFRSNFDLLNLPRDSRHVAEAANSNARPEVEIHAPKS